MTEFPKKFERVTWSIGDQKKPGLKKRAAEHVGQRLGRIGTTTSTGFHLEVGRMAEFKPASVRNVMRKAGVTRVSVESRETLREVIENYATDVASRAVRFAEHAGRRTVTADDIQLALV